MAFDGVGGAMVQKDRQIAGGWHLIGEARVAAVAIRPAQPHGLAVHDLLEDHLVAGHRDSPQPPARPARSPASRKKPELDPPSTRTISYAGTPTAARLRLASGEDSSTALTNSGRPISRQLGQTAWAMETLVRGRMIWTRQSHRGQWTATTSSRSRTKVSGPSSLSRAASIKSVTAAAWPKGSSVGTG